MGLSELDYKVLRYLMGKGRMTWSELASLLELSAPAAADRVRRLEDQQVITGYAALVNPEMVGCHVMAFIVVTLEHPQYRSDFLAKVHTLAEIQECHHVTGEGDYLLKVRCRTTKDLEYLISEELKGLDGVLSTRTTIALSTVKETPVLPITPLDSEG